MAMVRVYNENQFTHSEQFKGDQITIKPGEFVEMDYYEAVEFMGQYAPVKLDYDGNPTKETRKMLRMVKDFAPEAVVKPKYVDQLTGRSFDSEAELKAHLEANKDQYKASALVDEDAEAEVKRVGRPRKAV